MIISCHAWIKKTCLDGRTEKSHHQNDKNVDTAFFSQSKTMNATSTITTETTTDEREEQQTRKLDRCFVKRGDVIDELT